MSYADICANWVRYVLYGEGKAASSERSRVYYQGDTIYSYGTHFPMAIAIRERPRDADRTPLVGWGVRDGTPTEGRLKFILVNGDGFSPSTTNHQGRVREALDGIESIIIPFTALNAAGIDRTTIEPVHVRADRTETFHHSQAEEPTGERLMMDDPSGKTKTVMRRRYDLTLSDPSSEYPEEVPERVPDPNRRYLRANTTWPVAEFDPHTDEWHWETHRHWLGDSLFIARSNGRRRRFLSSFDYQEARPLYFLCEMPRTSDACSVEQAYEDLKPEEVKTAEAAGLEPTRQGDMFAVPTELTTREVKLLTPHRKGRIVKRPRRGLLGTNHTASEVLFCTYGRVYARGLLYHEPGAHRPADHARRKMGDGKTWHLLTKNTVPRAQPRTRTREAV